MEQPELEDRLLKLEAQQLVTNTMIEAMLKSHPRPDSFLDHWHHARAWVEASWIQVSNELPFDAETRSGLEHIRSAFSRAEAQIDQQLRPRRSRPSP